MGGPKKRPASDKKRATTKGKEERRRGTPRSVILKQGKGKE